MKYDVEAGGKVVRGVDSTRRAENVNIQLDATEQKKMAEYVLRAIRKEIAKDVAKAAAPRNPGEPVKLPQTKKFAESFSVRVAGGKLEVVSTWPTAEVHTKKTNDTRDRTPPYEMKWLSQPDMTALRIARSGGEVVFRTTPNPSKGGRYWIHPGFRKYNFLRRGIDKGVAEFLESLGEKLVIKHLEAGGSL